MLFQVVLIMIVHQPALEELQIIRGHEKPMASSLDPTEVQTNRCDGPCDLRMSPFLLVLCRSRRVLGFNLEPTYFI